MPFDGLMSFIGGLTNGARAYNPIDDPLGRIADHAQQQHHRAVPMDIREVVDHLYEGAKQNLRDGTGQMLPLKSSFLYGTWISYYKCEFAEEEPHTVRWIDVNHPLVMFFHWHAFRVQAKCLRSMNRPYGRIALYPENEVQRFLDFVAAFCEQYELPLAGDVHLDPPTREGEDGDVVAPELKDNSGSGLLSLEEVSLEDEQGDPLVQQETGDWANGHLHNIDGEWDVYVKRVYEEVCQIQTDPRRQFPCYEDIFYNMSCTVIRVSPHDIRKYWWMDSKHAFTAHPLMQNVQPVDCFNASYGRCSVYEDHVIQRVVDALLKDFSCRNLCVDVGAIGSNGHVLPPTARPVFGEQV